MRTLWFATVLIAFGFATAVAPAADVFFSGTLTSSNYSPAGANLGTEGYWFANFNAGAGVNDAPPDQDEVRQLPGHVTLSFGDTIDSAGGWGGYSDLTLPDGTVGNSGALEMNNAPGNVAGRQEDYLTLTLGAGAPNKMRLGLVIDNTDGLVFSNSQVLVNGVSTGPLTNDLVADVKFFDVFDISPGDTLVVEGISSTASVSHLGGFLLDPLHTIDLEVQTNGTVRIIPPSGADLDIKGYSVTSASGALNTAGWTGLETALGNGNPTDGIGWEKLGPGLSTKVGEFNLTGSTVFGAGGINTPQDLGSLFTPGGAQDLQLQFTLANGTLINGAVSYVPGVAVDGDYNGNGVVDAADYVVWRKLLNQSGAGLPADGDGNNVVDGDDYTYWRERFGNTAPGGGSVASAAAVPEPASLIFVLAVASTLLIRRCGKKSCCLALITLVCLTSAAGDLAHAAVTIDRDYRLGDEPSEGAVQNNQLGSGNAFGSTFDSNGSSGAGDLQDLTPGGGSVTYTNVSSRPLAGSSQLGGLFAGGYLHGDFESGAGGLGYPGADPSPNFNPGVDYSGVTTRGMQLWVNPTDNAARQEIINDTYQFGIHINADDTWGMTWGATGAAATTGRVINSTTPVSYGTWSHVHQHSYGNTRGVLYVNGVAVATSLAGQIYQLTQPTPGDRDMTVGATLFAFDNLYSGSMDDIELYVAGVSTDTSTDYGTFDLGADNEYIASLNLTPGDLTDDDVVDDDDVDIFVDNWRRQQLLSGRRTGDINSRMFGDFDYDGFVGILDWHFIRENHVDGGSLNLGALLAQAGVPEPSTWVILAAGMLAVSLSRRRRERRLAVGRLLGLVLLAGGLTAGSARAADVWNVDFQGDTTSGGFFGQSDTAKDYGPDASGIWNHFDVPALSADPQVNFATDPSLNLVDNDGTASPVTVTLNGMYAGWNGAATDHPLFGDYVIILGNGILGFPAPPLNFSVAGLTPGVEYGLRVISGNVSVVRDLLVTIDNDGNGSLANDTPAVAPSGGVGTDLSFTASASGGLVGTMDLNSAVEANLAGLQIKVGDFNPILTINRETGAMTLLNNTDAAVNTTIYSIESNTAGALDPAQWLSITDNYDASSGSPTVDPDSDWFELTQASDRDNLSEAQDVSGTGAVISDGQSFSLGSPWIRSPLEDITMQMLRVDGTVQDVTVRYTGQAPVIGDLDFDRDVDVTDWALFKTGFSTDLVNLSAAERYGQGDFTLDGSIDLDDANAFATAFDAMNGAGSFAAVVAGSLVPEPATWTLWLVGLAVVWSTGRRSATG